ncbi:alpha/beta hydrolase, partial [Acinetobacter baumannii]
ETHLNHALNLSEEDILKYSPIYQKERTDIPCRILCGDLELSELQWQSQNYFEHRCSTGHELVSFETISGVNHYSILDHYFKY